MNSLRWIANFLWARPRTIEQWHPLSPAEKAAARVARRQLGAAPPSRRKMKPFSWKWWIGRASDGSKRIAFDMRLLSPARLVELRDLAIERGYTGRAWRDDEAYAMNETSEIWAWAGLELASGEVICDVIVYQTQFENYEELGLARPVGVQARRHCLHIHKDDWRHLKRALRSDERAAYLKLQEALVLNRKELELW